MSPPARGLPPARAGDRRHGGGVDRDRVGGEAARANVAQNQMAERVDVVLGHLLEPVTAPMDLILANLTANLLMELAPAIAPRPRPEGAGGGPLPARETHEHPDWQDSSGEERASPANVDTLLLLSRYLLERARAM